MHISETSKTQVTYDTGDLVVSGTAANIEFSSEAEDPYQHTVDWGFRIKYNNIGMIGHE